MAKSLDHGEITTGQVEAWARHVTAPRAELFDDHADGLVDATRTLTVDDTWTRHAGGRRGPMIG